MERYGVPHVGGHCANSGAAILKARRFKQIWGHRWRRRPVSLGAGRSGAAAQGALERRWAGRAQGSGGGGSVFSVRFLDHGVTPSSFFVKNISRRPRTVGARK
eukprot:gene8986-biopygen6162